MTGNAGGEDSDPIPLWKWEVAADPDIPPGVIEFRHPDGRKDWFLSLELLLASDD